MRYWTHYFVRLPPGGCKAIGLIVFLAPNTTVLIDVIAGVRNIRGEMNIAPSLEMEVVVQSDDGNIRETIEQHQDVVSNLAKLKSLAVTGSGERPKSSATAVIEGATIFVSLEGVIDFAKESERLEKEINKLDGELAKVIKKLENEAFLSKAPANVVAEVKAKHAGLTEKKEKVQSNLDRIKELS